MVWHEEWGPAPELDTSYMWVYVPYTIIAYISSATTQLFTLNVVDTPLKNGVVLMMNDVVGTNTAQTTHSSFIHDYFGYVVPNTQHFNAVVAFPFEFEETDEAVEYYMDNTAAVTITPEAGIDAPVTVNLPTA